MFYNCASISYLYVLLVPVTVNRIEAGAFKNKYGLILKSKKSLFERLNGES